MLRKSTVSILTFRLVTLPSLPSTAVNLSSVIYSSTPGLQGVKRYNQNTAKYKLDTQGFFADHCKDFDSVHRVCILNLQFLNTKDFFLDYC